MTHTEEQLLALLKLRSFKLGQFQLASGGSSNYYIDLRTTSVCSQGANLIGQVIYDHTKYLNIQAIGGLQVGAVPLVTSAVMTYHRYGRALEGFWVRDEAKSHGTQKRVEGGLEPGTRVGIVEDVSTQGRSALKAVEAVRELGCEVVLILTLVDRLQGARELFQQQGIENFQSVFTIRDFGID